MFTLLNQYEPVVAECKRTVNFLPFKLQLSIRRATAKFFTKVQCFRKLNLFCILSKGKQSAELLMVRALYPFVDL